MALSTSGAGDVLFGIGGGDSVRIAMADNDGRCKREKKKKQNKLELLIL
jgi:hypothetical protein